MALVDITMVNNDNGKEFLFRGVQPASRRRSQPAISVPLINTTEANTFLFRFMGQSGFFEFNFAIFADGTDVSNGTESGGVISVQEQIQYLFDTFFSDNYDVDWTIEANEFFSTDVDGVITDLNVDASSGASIRFGRIVFQRGRIGAL